MVFLDVGACVVTSNVPDIEGDGVESATITVRVLNTDGNPIQGLEASKCVLAVSGTGNTVTQPTGYTDRNGDISGSFVSTVDATKTCSWTVLGAAVTDTVAVDVGTFVGETVNMNVWEFS